MIAGDVAAIESFSGDNAGIMPVPNELASELQQGNIEEAQAVPEEESPHSSEVNVHALDNCSETTDSWPHINIIFCNSVHQMWL